MIGRPRTQLTACLIGPCGKKARTKGLCSAHYEAQRQGKTIQQMAERYHITPGGERFYGRATRSANAVLRAFCKKRGVARYGLVSEIVEEWATAHRSEVAALAEELERNPPKSAPGKKGKPPKAA